MVQATTQQAAVNFEWANAVVDRFGRFLDDPLSYLHNGYRDGGRLQDSVGDVRRAVVSLARAYAQRGFEVETQMMITACGFLAGVITGPDALRLRRLNVALAAAPKLGQGPATEGAIFMLAQTFSKVGDLTALHRARDSQEALLRHEVEQAIAVGKRDALHR